MNKNYILKKISAKLIILFKIIKNFDNIHIQLYG